MLWFEMADDPQQVEFHREVIRDYRARAAEVADEFPPDMSEGDRLTAWLMIVQLHALGMMIEPDDPEPWEEGYDG